jgi:hypothetical protein
MVRRSAVERGNHVIVKLCGRQISELPPGQWHGVVRLSRGTPEIARVLYEGPATITVQYAIISRTPTVRPRLGDPIGIVSLGLSEHDWPSYKLWQHLRPDGSLVVDTFILELFDEDGDDRPCNERSLPRDPLR